MLRYLSQLPTAVRHFCFWTLSIAILYISAIIVAKPSPIHYEVILSEGFLTNELVEIASAVLLGMIHYRLLVLPYLFKHKYVQYALRIIPFLMVAVLSILLPEFIYNSSFLSFKNISYLLQHIFISMIIFYLPFAVLYACIENIKRSIILYRDIEYNKRKTAALLLKSKLDTHFLFNALNTIYAIALQEQAHKTLTLIDTLSEQLRTKLSSADGNKITAPTHNPYKDHTILDGIKNTTLRHFFIITLSLTAFMLLPPLLSASKWSQQDYIRYLFYIPLTICMLTTMVICHYHFLYKPYFMVGKYWRYLCYLFPFLLLMIGVDVVVDTVFLMWIESFSFKEDFYKIIQIATTRMVIFGSVMAAIYAVYRHYHFLQQSISNYNTQSRENELKMLAERVDAKEIVNSLASLNDSAYSDNAHHTAQAINELSALFSYTSAQAGQYLVNLSDEFVFLQQYVYFQLRRISQSENMKITAHIQHNNLLGTIAPMLLLPFIENAFKHGVSYEHKSEININITVAAHTLTCHITNTLHKRSTLPNTTGIGLSNTTKRLELQYEGKHKLIQRCENNLYEVHLTIVLV
jgi:sensor histidine kinase YesM